MFHLFALWQIVELASFLLLFYLQKFLCSLGLQLSSSSGLNRCFRPMWEGSVQLGSFPDLLSPNNLDTPTLLRHSFSSCSSSDIFFAPPSCVLPPSFFRKFVGMALLSILIYTVLKKTIAFFILLLLLCFLPFCH